MLDEYRGRADVGVAVGERGGDRRVAGSGAAVPVFSVTKMFVATAALRLAESALLRLDDVVRRWLPASPRGLTVAQLLGHTGGLADYASSPEYLAAVAAHPDRPWGPDEIMTIGLAGERTGAGRFRYSNLGYWMLGAVLEHVGGAPLGEVLAGSVFVPAGMEATCYPRVGAGLTPDGYDTCWAGPAGAAWSTPADLVAFLDALFGEALLSPASLRAMTTATPVDAGPPWRRPGYGLGLMVDEGRGTYGHGGGGPGYRSAAFTAPGQGRAVALVTRTSVSIDPIDVALRLLDAGR